MQKHLLKILFIFLLFSTFNSYEEIQYSIVTGLLGPVHDSFSVTFNKNNGIKAQYEKVGSQDFTKITIDRKINSEESGKINIVYTGDGKVFLDDDAAVAIAWKSEDELGKQLAMVCKYRDQSIRKDNEHYQKIMVKNYRHCK